jgi:hypothetical protein
VNSLTSTSSIASPASPLGAVDAWRQAAEAQRRAARDVGRTIADTLSVQFPGAAYLTLKVQEDTPRDWELFPETVRDPAGHVLFDFATDLPPLPPEHGELRKQWGALNPANAFDVRALLRFLYIAGAVFDRLPEDLEGEDDDAEQERLCLLLSPQARPATWEAEDPDHWQVEARRLRPYAVARPE